MAKDFHPAGEKKGKRAHMLPMGGKKKAREMEIEMKRDA